MNKNKDPMHGDGRDEASEPASSQPLSFGQLSALCSNLAKGCEKQYLPEEANLFKQLADYFQGKVPPVDEAQISDLQTLLKKDLDNGYSSANQVSAGVSDRGALRALVWGEKVTKIVQSMLARYEKQQEAILQDKNLYVCEICGFVYIGNEAPEICPVCKVPRLKITQVQRR